MLFKIFSKITYSIVQSDRCWGNYMQRGVHILIFLSHVQHDAFIQGRCHSGSFDWWTEFRDSQSAFNHMIFFITVEKYWNCLDFDQIKFKKNGKYIFGYRFLLLTSGHLVESDCETLRLGCLTFDHAKGKGTFPLVLLLLKKVNQSRGHKSSVKEILSFSFFF